jgi:hypothetical protein
LFVRRVPFRWWSLTPQLESAPVRSAGPVRWRTGCSFPRTRTSVTRRTNRSRLPTEALATTIGTAPAGLTKARSQPRRLFPLSQTRPKHATFRCFPSPSASSRYGPSLKRWVGVCQGTLSRLDKPPPTVTTIEYRGDAEAQDPGPARQGTATKPNAQTAPKHRHNRADLDKREAARQTPALTGGYGPFRAYSTSQTHWDGRAQAVDNRTRLWITDSVRAGVGADWRHDIGIGSARFIVAYCCCAGSCCVGA